MPGSVGRAGIARPGRLGVVDTSIAARLDGDAGLSGSTFAAGESEYPACATWPLSRFGMRVAVCGNLPPPDRDTPAPTSEPAENISIVNSYKSFFKYRPLTGRSLVQIQPPQFSNQTNCIALATRSLNPRERGVPLGAVRGTPSRCRSPLLPQLRRLVHQRHPSRRSLLLG